MKAKDVLLSIYNLRDTVTNKAALWATAFVDRGHISYITAALLSIMGVLMIPVIMSVVVFWVAVLLLLTTAAALAVTSTVAFEVVWAYQIYKTTIKKNPELDRTEVLFIVLYCCLVVRVVMHYYAYLITQPLTQALLWMFEYAVAMVRPGA